MKTHVLVLFLGLLFVGCVGEQVQFVDAADPALPRKLGISDQDWSQIKQVASGQKEFIIKDAGKAAPNVIEVEFKKLDDTRNDQGGPTERYEKKAAGWVKQTDFQGYWAVGKGRSQ
jgi:hypothetical protein